MVLENLSDNTLSKDPPSYQNIRPPSSSYTELSLCGELYILSASIRLLLSSHVQPESVDHTISQILLR